MESETFKTYKRTSAYSRTNYVASTKRFVYTVLKKGKQNYFGFNFTFYGDNPYCCGKNSYDWCNK